MEQSEFIKRKMFFHKNRKIKNILFGIFFIIVGSALLADKIGLLPENLYNIIFSWQMLLIGIGYLIITGRSLFPGAVLIIVGGIFLIPIIFNVGFSISYLIFPALFIFAGLLIILRLIFKPKFNFHENCFQQVNTENL